MNIDLHFHIPHWLAIGGGIVIGIVVLFFAVVGFLMMRSMKDFPFGA